MASKIKKTIKNGILSVVGIFIDKYSFLHFKRDQNFFKLFVYSIRFRLAGLGVYLTSNEKQIAALKDIHRGKRCFIIGNGPSLNELDLSKLKDEYTFGVNSIYLNVDQMGFSPTYYVIEDYLIAEDKADAINKYSGSEIKFFGSYLEYVLKKDSKSLVVNVHVNYEADNYVPLFSTNAVRRLGVGGSVTFMCLQIAYYMGFKDVYMIGFDHNYKEPSESDIVKDGYVVSNTEDNNHFSKAYVGKGTRWHLPQLERMEVGFAAADKAFRADDRKVLNATKGGRLEVFERCNYDDIFNA